jgi:lipoprotein-anchoring transpeptidase ErfK/SrfK
MQLRILYETQNAGNEVSFGGINMTNDIVKYIYDMFPFSVFIFSTDL